MSVKKPFVYSLYDNPIPPGEIEAKSFEAIDREAGAHSFTPEEWIVVRRMIHTTADFSLIKDTLFSDGAIDSAVSALGRAGMIYADSNMIRAGISQARLISVNPTYNKEEKVICHVADEDVADESKKAGLPRSLFAVRKGGKALEGAVALIGNAPVALMELCRMIKEDDVRPAVVVGAPVGFVHVVESKRELMSLDIPYITVRGRRGGSALAVSVIHSLCSIASGRKEGGA